MDNFRNTMLELLKACQTVSYSERVKYGADVLAELKSQVYERYTGKSLEVYDFPMFFVFALLLARVSADGDLKKNIQYVVDIVNREAGPGKGDLDEKRAVKALTTDTDDLFRVYKAYTKCLKGNEKLGKRVGGLIAMIDTLDGKIHPKDADNLIDYFKDIV